MDTTSPQGTFTLQVLGAAVELELALIRDRTKAGLVWAEGRVGGNPAMRRKLAAAWMEKLAAEVQGWVPIVRCARPDVCLGRKWLLPETVLGRAPCLPGAAPRTHGGTV